MMLGGIPLIARSKVETSFVVDLELARSWKKKRSKKTKFFILILTCHLSMSFDKKKKKSESEGSGSFSLKLKFSHSLLFRYPTSRRIQLPFDHVKFSTMSTSPLLNFLLFRNILPDLHSQRDFMFRAKALVCALRGYKYMHNGCAENLQKYQILIFPIFQQRSHQLSTEIMIISIVSLSPCQLGNLTSAVCCVVRLKRMEVAETLHTLAVKLLLCERNLNFTKI